MVICGVYAQNLKHEQINAGSGFCEILSILLLIADKLIDNLLTVK